MLYGSCKWLALFAHKENKKHSAIFFISKLMQCINIYAKMSHFCIAEKSNVCNVFTTKCFKFSFSATYAFLFFKFNASLSWKFVKCVHWNNKIALKGLQNYSLHISSLVFMNANIICAAMPGAQMAFNFWLKMSIQSILNLQMSNFGIE